jgi:glycosyltransferase involved in cell wall biosynthesis
MKPVRVGVVCDLKEEGWHSMDLIGDMLLETLPKIADGTIAATRLCPPMVPRWTRLPVVGGAARARLGDRLTGRLWDFPRWLAPRVDAFDVFHVVDHSYAHLLRVLPPERTIVTCNDVDAIQPALPGVASRVGPARLLASRILEGLSDATRVACISHATRDNLLATGRIKPDRADVVYLGVHPSCSPVPDAAWDAEINRQLGQKRLEILHVGSTIPRKRIDILLNVFSEVHKAVDGVRLIRVGGPLTDSQRACAGKLGIAGAIVELPFLERPLLAALYRRVDLLVLPSEREGFGLPVVEAMASGTPAVASAIPALREAGGDAAIYCPLGDVAQWAATLRDLLRRRQSSPSEWETRRRASIASAARFDWSAYATEMTNLYLKVADP